MAIQLIPDAPFTVLYLHNPHVHITITIAMRLSPIQDTVTYLSTCIRKTIVSVHACGA